MNCEAVGRKLSEYLEGDLRGPERAAVAAHLETCTGCRAEAAALRRAHTALEMLATVEVAPDLTEDLHRRLAAAARRRFRLAWIGPAAAVAAAAAVGACLLWLGHPAPAPRPAPSRSPAVAPRMTVERRESVAPVIVKEPERVDSHSRHRSPPQVTERVLGLGWEAPSIEVVEAPATEAVEAPTTEATEKPATEVMEASLRDESDWPVFVRRRAAPVEKPVPRFGVVLLLGEPEPILPSSYCYLEVSLPDGAKSIVDQTVERDAAGEPRAVQISYQQIASEAEALNQGG